MSDRGATPAEEIVEILDTWNDEGTAEMSASHVAQLREEMFDSDPTILMSEEEVKRLCRACKASTG
jgi:hypothetical protein